jgi:tyrosinase
MSHFIITGASGGQTQNAAAPNRREIKDLINDVNQFSLYIQALSRLPFNFYSSSISSLIAK